MEQVTETLIPTEKPDDEEVVSFDVGGSVFRITNKTLVNFESDNLFYKLYRNDKEKRFKVLKTDGGKHIFIDHRSKNVPKLLEYFRSGTIPCPITDSLNEDIQFFGCDNLSAILKQSGDLPLVKKRKYDCLTQACSDDVLEKSDWEFVLTVPFDSCLAQWKLADLNNVFSLSKLLRWRVVYVNDEKWQSIKTKAALPYGLTTCILVYKGKYTAFGSLTWHEIILNFSKLYSLNDEEE